MAGDKKKVIYFLHDEIFYGHDTGELHPENPGRLKAIYNKLKSEGFLEKVIKLQAGKIDINSLKSVHDPDYINRVKLECESGCSLLSTGDTDVCRASNDVALNAAGGVIEVVDRIFRTETKRGFCAVRPPGHHASSDKGMGFCIFNNVAIAAKYAIEKFNVTRVMIIDWDVHHGNGTQDIFYEDNSVYFVSTHQHPLYPGTGATVETGEGEGEGYTLNIPLAKGSGNKEVITAFRQKIIPEAKEFKPELVLISAGFDSRIEDPIGGLSIDDNGFRELTKMIIEISEYSGSGRIVSILEGGYNPRGLASAVYSHMDELSR